MKKINDLLSSFRDMANLYAEQRKNTLGKKTLNKILKGAEKQAKSGKFGYRYADSCLDEYEITDFLISEILKYNLKVVSGRYGSCNDIALTNMPFLDISWL